MPTPQTADEADDTLDELSEATEETAAEADVDERMASPVTATGRASIAGEEDFFAGTDDIKEPESGQTREGAPEEPSEPAPEMEGAGEHDMMMEEVEEYEEHSFEEPINEGFARFAVLRLPDSWETDEGETKRKDDLQEEMNEVFEAFQLGHYGNRCLHEYVLVGAGDINPVYGLMGSMVACTALAVVMRPDGDELVTTATERLKEAGASE